MLPSLSGLQLLISHQSLIHSMNPTDSFACQPPPPTVSTPHCQTLTMTQFGSISILLNTVPESSSSEAFCLASLLQQPQALTAQKTCPYQLSGGRCLLRTCFSLPYHSVTSSRSFFFSIRFLLWGDPITRYVDAGRHSFLSSTSPETPGDTSHKECGFPDLGGERRGDHF